MVDVTFFHSERFDGGRRDGLLLDGDRALEHFTPGGDEPDPRLLWHVDIHCPTDRPPQTLDEAFRWVADHRAALGEVLARTADELAAGIDIDLMGWGRGGVGPGGRYSVRVAATRTLAAAEVGTRLRELAAAWPDVLATLTPFSPAGA